MSYQSKQHDIEEEEEEVESSENDDKQYDVEKIKSVSWCKAYWEMSSLSFTTTLLRGIKTALPAVNSAFIARINSQTSAAVTLLTAYEDSISIVMNSPTFYVPTAVGELYKKQDDSGKQNIGSVIQAGWLVSQACTVPQIVLYLLAGPILEKICKQEHELANINKKFFTIYAFATPFLSFQSVSDQFALTTGSGHLPLWVNFLDGLESTIFAYGLCFGRFGLPELGVQGVAIAILGRSVANVIMFHSYVGLSVVSKLKFSDYNLTKFNAKTFIKELCNMSIGGAIMMIIFASQMGSTLVINLIIGKYGEVALRAQLPCMVYDGVLLVFATGFGTAAQIKIANTYKDKNWSAFRYVLSAMTYSVIPPVLYTILVLAIPKYLIYPWIDPFDDANKDVVEVLLDKKLLLVSALVSFLNSFNTIIGQSLVGMKSMIFSIGLEVVLGWAGVLVSDLLGSVAFDKNIVALKCGSLISQAASCAIGGGYLTYRLIRLACSKDKSEDTKIAEEQEPENRPILSTTGSIQDVPVGFFKNYHEEQEEARERKQNWCCIF